MCINSCVTFTGPFAHLEQCPLCHKHLDDQECLRKSNGKNKIPRKVSRMLPLDPQLQAHWRNAQMAKKMHYQQHKTCELLEKHACGEDYIYNNISCGMDYLDTVEDGAIQNSDEVVMLSVDGACQEIGLVALMFFFELLFSYVSLTISCYFFLTNLFSLIHFLIC